MSKRGLIAIVGPAAAGILLTLVPAEESGRKVAVTVKPDNTVAVQHISGRQYLKAYLDIAGIPTACDGITRGVKMGQTYTEAQCAALLERELVIHAEGVMRCTPGLKIDRNPYQIVGAVSLGYNIGVAGWCGSTAARRMNAGRMVEGCDAILMWDKARVNGTLRPVKGLTKRRNREHQYCLTGLTQTPATLEARLKPYH